MCRCRVLGWRGGAGGGSSVEEGGVSLRVMCGGGDDLVWGRGK